MQAPVAASAAGPGRRPGGPRLDPQPLAGRAPLGQPRPLRRRDRPHPPRSASWPARRSRWRRTCSAASGVRHYYIAFATPAEMRFQGGFVGAYGILTADGRPGQPRAVRSDRGAQRGPRRRGAVAARAVDLPGALRPAAPGPLPPEPHRVTRHAGQRPGRRPGAPPGRHPAHRRGDLRRPDRAGRAAPPDRAGHRARPGRDRSPRTTPPTTSSATSTSPDRPTTARQDGLDRGVGRHVRRAREPRPPQPGRDRQRPRRPAMRGGHLLFTTFDPDRGGLLHPARLDRHLPRRGAPRPGRPTTSTGPATGSRCARRTPGATRSTASSAREVHYDATVDPTTGSVQATATVTLHNDAPASGLPDYVIGNLFGLPRGTNRLYLGFFTSDELQQATLDGRPLAVESQHEFAGNVYSSLLDIPPGGTVVVTFTLSGSIRPGPDAVDGYRLGIGHQPLVTDDHLSVEVHLPDPGPWRIGGRHADLGRRRAHAGGHRRQLGHRRPRGVHRRCAARGPPPALSAASIGSSHPGPGGHHGHPVPDQPDCAIRRSARGRPRHRKSTDAYQAFPPGPHGASRDARGPRAPGGSGIGPDLSQHPDAHRRQAGRAPVHHRRAHRYRVPARHARDRSPSAAPSSAR